MTRDELNLTAEETAILDVVRPGQPVKVLGPGLVTCGHCANATVQR